MNTQEIIELAKQYVKATEQQAQEEATGYPVAAMLTEQRVVETKAALREALYPASEFDYMALIKAVEAAKAVMALEEYLAN